MKELFRYRPVLTNGVFSPTVVHQVESALVCVARSDIPQISIRFEKPNCTIASRARHIDRSNFQVGPTWTWQVTSGRSPVAGHHGNGPGPP
ncbi:MAG: hypothetical protein CMJ59_05710 [Planctomycetaceae bacterium]|nr:hypothetical protein [Planctomycetaceae bacterium]